MLNKCWGKMTSGTQFIDSFLQLIDGYPGDTGQEEKQELTTASWELRECGGGIKRKHLRRGRERDSKGHTVATEQELGDSVTFRVNMDSGQNVMVLTVAEAAA